MSISCYFHMWTVRDKKKLLSHCKALWICAPNSKYCENCWWVFLLLKVHGLKHVLGKEFSDICLFSCEMQCAKRCLTTYVVAWHMYLSVFREMHEWIESEYMKVKWVFLSLGCFEQYSRSCESYGYLRYCMCVCFVL